MSVYMIIESKSRDPGSYARYIDLVPPIVAKYGAGISCEAER